MNQIGVSDTWKQGAAYEVYVGRWSRLLAPEFLKQLEMAPGQRWLDIGCGTGALCNAILTHCKPAAVAGLELSDGFLQSAQKEFAGKVMLLRGSAAAIPLADGCIDVAVSGLALNFVPDPLQGVTEMVRVTQGGGTIAAYVWDYADKMEFIRIFWDAANHLNPDARQFDEGIRFPVCKPEALVALFRSAGLNDPKVTPLDLVTNFLSFDDFWQPFLGGQGPAPAYLMSLDDAGRARLREQVKHLLPFKPDGSISLIARAWAIQAQR